MDYLTKRNVELEFKNWLDTAPEEIRQHGWVFKTCSMLAKVTAHLPLESDLTPLELNVLEDMIATLNLKDNQLLLIQRIVTKTREWMNTINEIKEFNKLNVLMGTSPLNDSSKG